MYYKIKLAGIALGTSLIVVPPTLNKVSHFYIETYQAGTEKLTEVTENTLQSVGLTTIKGEAQIETLIVEAATEFKIPPKLLASLVHNESRGNSDAYSPKSAIGLAQIMPFNAKRCGLKKISQLWDERNNIRCGAQILSEELKTTKGKLIPALQIYNGGPKCVNRCAESIQYARNVTDRFAELSLK